MRCLYLLCLRWIAAGCMLALPCSVGAEQLFRIGTGAPSGTYFPIGKAMGAALSEPGVLAVNAQATNGSVANVSAVGLGEIESGLSQADVASWHYSGTGMVKASSKLESLRLIATLYPESVHVVVRKAAGVRTVDQLKGLRVALDEPGSGVLINARQILRAYGLSERDIQPAYIKGAQAAQRIKEGSLDALFFVGGVPSVFVSELANAVEIVLLPIDGTAADALRQGSSFFTPSNIPTGSYAGTANVKTLAVSAQWITHASADTALIYKLTRRLFSPDALLQIQQSHPNARSITPEMAVQGAGLPLHPGAERFYREVGVLK
jgi:uncharacterized protein